MMKPLTMLWIILGCVFVPLLVLVAAAWLSLWKRKRRADRVPIAEKLLRPAGESLRVQIEQLNEKFGEAMFIAILFPAIVLASVLFSSPSGNVTVTRFVVGLALCLMLVAFTATRVFQIGAKLRNCLLGFHGERAVGEEINQLMREGCRVFHDVPNDPYGNIDHVIVAPSGVYAVETKTRRKRKAPAGKKDHQVIYDGKTLEYPHCCDAHGLEQAQHQANRLRVMLTKAVGEPVNVSPILTLPGWFVSSRVNSGMKVVNPKQIRQVILNSGDSYLTPQLIERISHQLDQLCRDVEL